MTVNPTSATSAEHYAWGNQCDGWHLVRAAQLSAIEERMPAGASEVRHWHARALQFFYVVEGTLRMDIEGALHTLPAGTGVEIPQGTAHQARNDSESAVRFLVISSPPHQGDRKELEAEQG